MKKHFILLLFTLLAGKYSNSQTITEKELFLLNYNGNADAYSFVLDSNSGKYCYLYTVPDENKTFIVSGDAVSEKFDYISAQDIRFDSKANYYTVTANYRPDYGIDNNFLVVNGKTVLNYDYIEPYSSYINKKGEFVFIFKDHDLYKIGYYGLEGGLRQSDGYELIRPIMRYNAGQHQREDEGDTYLEDDFYHNEAGERGFIASSGGKTKIIFETGEIVTDYTDINETSITKNKNNELSYFAKTGGRFGDYAGNEFVVSGNKKYNKFDMLNTPLLFNNNNEPVYIAGDSLPGQYRYYLVIGNQKQPAYPGSGNTKKAFPFASGLNDISLNGNGDITYFGTNEIIVPAPKNTTGEEKYDQYYSRSFFVKNNTAYELGYNIGPVKYSDKGDMLYAGIADLKKKEYLLMMNYGASRIIINKHIYDDIYDYGFTPAKEIYYAAQNYEDAKLNKKNESFLYIGDKLIGKYDYLTYQNIGDSSSLLIFDSKNNYAFVAEKVIDSVTYSNFIVTNSGRLPFPSNVSGSNMFTYISNMMYSKNDKLFFIGDMNNGASANEAIKEIFVDNVTLGKTYNSITGIKYDKSRNEITFTGARENKVYLVTVKL